MPAADPGRESFYKYLKQEFPWKKDWKPENIKNLTRSYSYLEIKNALQELKGINPEIYKYVSYLVNSGRNRFDIATFLECDNSTLKRKCNKGFDIILNMLNNSDCFEKLKPINFYNE